MTEIRTTLKQLRKQRGWNQSEIACRLGISMTSYWKIETGFTDVNFSRLEQIAAVYEISVIELFGCSNTLTEQRKDKVSAFFDSIFILDIKLNDLRREIAELKMQINQPINE